MKHASVGQVTTLFAQYGAEAWLELVFRHGKTFRLQQFVVTCDTRLIEPLMLDRAHTRRRSRAHKVVHRITPGSAGLLFLDGPRWEVQRRAVAPTFTREHVQQYAELIYSTTLQWGSNTPQRHDLFSAITRLGARLVLQSGYGLHASDPHARAYMNELIDYKQNTMQRDPRCRLDVLGIRRHETAGLALVIADTPEPASSRRAHAAVGPATSRPAWTVPGAYAKLARRSGHRTTSLA
jgi:cytochrome P450